MQETIDLTSFIPFLIGFGTCITVVIVSIVIFRALTLNTNELLLKITALALASSTLFFYCVIWLGATILSPTGNHLTTILICYLFTGILPSIFLYTKIDNSKANKVTEMEIKKHNENKNI